MDERLQIARNYWQPGVLLVRLAVKSARRGDFHDAELLIREGQFRLLDAKVILQS